MGFPLKITLIYALVSIAWIATSDRAVMMMFDPTELPIIQSYKAWFFILFTSIMLYLFLAQETRRREQIETTLARQRESINRLTQAVEQSPASIIVSTTDGQIDYVNNAFETMSGFKRTDVIEGKSNPRLFDSGKTPESVYQELWEKVNSGQQWQGELINKHVDGSSYWVHAQVSPVTNEAGQVSHFLIIEEDITSHKNQENRIKHRASYDSLTELPNRFLAMDRMSQAINTAIRHDQTVALMYIDLDDLSNINDAYGDEVGDQLITLAAARIEETVRQTDTVARYGDDEFLVILNHVDILTDSPRVAEKLLSSIANSYFIDDKEIKITASVGISIFPEDGQDPYELLRHANAAMFAAKDEGGNRYEFYSAEVNAAAVKRMHIEQQLRNALDNNELTLEYQPLVRTSDSKITDAEVLLRWNNPELGAIKPDTFLPLAEASGLILPIGEWMIKSACAQLKQWHMQGLDDLRLLINLSAKQFNDFNLLPTISGALQTSQINGQYIEFEITENLLSRNTEDTLAILSKLKDLNISIALDNFGTGDSAVNHLKNFPFDTLKIDHSSVHQLFSNSDDKAIVDSTISLAKGLGLTTVGEGVETQEQSEYLKQLGVDKVQGFLYTPAISADQFLSYVQHFDERSVNG